MRACEAATRISARGSLPLQKLRRPLTPEVAGDVGGGLAAVVLEVERRAVFDERLDRGVDVVNAGGRIMARRPHQRCEAVGVTAVDVDAGLSSSATTGA